MLAQFAPVPGYIDPTGGLPPSVWAALVAPLVGAVGLAAFALHRYARRALRLLGGRVVVVLIALALAAGFTVVLVFRAQSGSQAPAGGARVAILGMDGLDPVLLRRYMGEGRLPNFARLARRGVFHELGTTTPPQSPVAWASFITGRDPGEHGLFDFIKRDPASYALDLSTADRRTMARPWRGTPWWQDEALRQAKVVALRVPLTFPPSKLGGRMLSGMGVWDARGTEGTSFLYSTGALPEDPRGMAFRLEGSGTRFRGELPGPYRVGQADMVREAFELEVEGHDAVLRIQGRSYRLSPGRWSDWIALEFRLGALRLDRVFALTRVLWRTSDAEVSLYVSPLNFDPARPPFPISYPKRFSKELCEALGPFHTRGMPFDTQALSDGVLSDDEFLAQLDFVTREHENMLAHELARFDSGILIAYFDAADSVQHTFWRAIDPEHPAYNEALAERRGGVIPECYERFDDILGRAMDALGPEAAVVVISDHGFGSFRRSVHLNSVLRDLGYLSIHDGGTASSEFFKDVDWSRTRAYAAGFNSVYLNVAGREGRGVVEASEAGALARRIARELEGVRDERTGQAPIKNVSVAAELFPGADSEDMPDLIVGYRRGYRASWETALGAAPAATFEDNVKPWSGDHLFDPEEVPGVFLSSAPGLDAETIAGVGRAVVDYWRRVSAAGARK